MTSIKKVIVSLLILILFTTSISFCDDSIKLTPSGNVVEMYISLKYPYVNSCLDSSNNKLQNEDIILSVIHNKEKISSLNKIYELMKLSKEKIEVVYIRKGKTKCKKMTTDDLRAYKFNDYIHCAGTVTAIDQDGNYIALSHNLTLNESEISIDSGLLLETTYVQETKSKDGSIGHLVTTSNNKKIGTIISMTKYGLQGKCDNFEYKPTKSLEISKPKPGTAYILCETPVTNEIKYHEIEILVVGEQSSKIQIKDKDLIDIRGGGVQGMSGSPIIQDGKIVGGMSHIYFKDSTLGIIANIHSMLEKSID